MKVKDLRASVDNIQIEEEMQKDIIRNVKAATEDNGSDELKNRRKESKRAYQNHRMRNVAAAAAVVIIASGLISIPVRAFVNSLIQERMEEMSQEEKTVLVEDTAQANADGFTREYTKAEESRMSELYKQYQEGTFPTGELPLADNVEKAKELGFCLLTTNSTFYLPERELTDEELLEIIDYYEKREYAIKENYEREYADEIAAQEEKEKEQIAEVVDAGGITEEKAIETATIWLEKIFGINGDGLEMHHYFEGDLQIATETEGLYMVNWTDMPNRQYYYFYISAKDGSLAEVTYSSSALTKQERPALAEAESLISGLEQKAVSFMEKQMQITYDDIYSAYYVFNNEKAARYVGFVFVQENNLAYKVNYAWDGTFSGFQKVDFTTYQQKEQEFCDTYEKAETSKGNETEAEFVFKKISK